MEYYKSFLKEQSLKDELKIIEKMEKVDNIKKLKKLTDTLNEFYITNKPISFTHELIRSGFLGIFEKDNKQFIERLVYPRYIGEITFGKDSDIENIEILDELFLKNMNVQFLAMALREAADYILLNDKTTH